MTKQEFKTLEKICKDEWNRRVKENDAEPDAKMNIFSCNCPACEISIRIKKIDHNNFDLFYCPYCPIEDWQKQTEGWYGHPVCESYEEAHDRFCQSIDSQYVIANKDQFQKACLEIANKEWKWMPEYEDIYVGDLLKHFGAI